MFYAVYERKKYIIYLDSDNLVTLWSTGKKNVCSAI